MLKIVISSVNLNLQSFQKNIEYKYIMSIDSTVVKKIANLAKIHINKEQEKNLISELNNILNWVDELHSVDTSDVEPMLSVFNESMLLREDKVDSNWGSEKILENAPEKESDFFVVPKVIE